MSSLLCVSEHPDFPWWWDDSHNMLLCGLGPIFVTGMSGECLEFLAQGGDDVPAVHQVRAIGHLVAREIALYRRGDA